MAKMKKGSKEAKAWGQKMKRARNKTLKSPTVKRRKPTTKYKNKTMAKKRTTRKKSSVSNKKLFGINLGKAFSTMLYGGIRSIASNKLAPYTSRIPLGIISDEAGLLLVSTFGKKIFKKNDIFKEVLTAGQTVELARIGEAVFNGQLGLNLFGQNQEANNNGYIFA